MSEARKELASKADTAEIRRELAEAKAGIIKWNLATVIAVTGVGIGTVEDNDLAPPA